VADNVTLGNGIYKMEAFYLGGGFTLYLDDTGPRT
jgi:hypothetical protein